MSQESLSDDEQGKNAKASERTRLLSWSRCQPCKDGARISVMALHGLCHSPEEGFVCPTACPWFPSHLTGLIKATTASSSPQHGGCCPLQGYGTPGGALWRHAAAPLGQCQCNLSSGEESADMLENCSVEEDVKDGVLEELNVRVWLRLQQGHGGRSRSQAQGRTNGRITGQGWGFRVPLLHLPCGQGRLADV